MNASKIKRHQREAHPGLVFRFGALLRSLRTAAGKTQTELAAGLNVATTRVNAVERGRVQGPGPAFVESLNGLLDLSSGQLSLLHSVAARDRVLLAATRSVLTETQLAFLSACLDASLALNPEDLEAHRRALLSQVVARERARRFLGEPVFAESSPGLSGKNALHKPM